MSEQISELQLKQEQCNELASLLVEAWDAMAAVIKVHHLRMHNISPTLIDRIELALEPWEDTQP